MWTIAERRKKISSIFICSQGQRWSFYCWYLSTRDRKEKKISLNSRRRTNLFVAKFKIFSPSEHQIMRRSSGSRKIKIYFCTRTKTLLTVWLAKNHFTIHANLTSVFVDLKIVLCFVLKSTKKIFFTKIWCSSCRVWRTSAQLPSKTTEKPSTLGRLKCRQYFFHHMSKSTEIAFSPNFHMFSLWFPLKNFSQLWIIDFVGFLLWISRSCGFEGRKSAEITLRAARVSEIFYILVTDVRWIILRGRSWRQYCHLD